MGYDLSTKRCAGCGGKDVDRPIDFWTGLPKGGKASQWYVVGDQNFCYPCANDENVMKQFAKVLAIQHGLDPEEGIKDFSKVRKMKFQFDYKMKLTDEEKRGDVDKDVVKQEIKGPSVAEMKEKNRRREERAKLREARFKKEGLLKNGKKNGWWQEKRRKEENIWHTEGLGRAGKEHSMDQKAKAVNRKSNKIQGADWDQYKEWFPRDQGGGQYR